MNASPLFVIGSGAADWPLLVLLIALAGTAVSFAARERAGLAFAAGLLMWAAVAVIAGTAWRTMNVPSTQLLTVCGATIIGFLAWLCAPSAELAPRQRAWLPALILAISCGAFGTAEAHDLLVLMIWLAVLGGANFAMTLAVAGLTPAVRPLIAFEALALVLAALALVFLGLASGSGQIAPPPGSAALAGAGLVLLTAQLLLRTGASIVSLSILARPGVLGAELAAGSLALPAFTITLVRLMAQFSHAWPAGFGVTVAGLGALVTLVCAAGFTVARERGPRLAFLGASLSGVALLLAGSSAGINVESFAELVFAPFAAIIAGSALRRSISARDTGVFGFGGTLELGLALAAFGVIGLPPFAGFWPRLFLMDASIKAGDLAVPATLVAGSLLLAYGLARSSFAPAEAQVRPAPVRVLEIAAFGVLLGLSLAAGLAPGPALDAQRPAHAGTTTLSEAAP